MNIEPLGPALGTTGPRYRDRDPILYSVTLGPLPHGHRRPPTLVFGSDLRRLSSFASTLGLLAAEASGTPAATHDSTSHCHVTEDVDSEFHFFGVSYGIYLWGSAGSGGSSGQEQQSPTQPKKMSPPPPPPPAKASSFARDTRSLRDGRIEFAQETAHG